MIVGEWQLVAETGQLTTVTDEPRRVVTIAWDGGDQSLYLSVIAPAAANVQGAQERVYSAPLSLLAALMIVPAQFHEVLATHVAGGRASAESQLFAHLERMTANAPQAWPKTVHVRESADKSAEVARQLERLSLDLAAAEAFGGDAPGVPV